MYEEDTIAAVATPPGEGGVAIVRISGPEAERIATRVFTRIKGNNGKLKSHTLYHGRIVAPETDHVFDEVLLAVMRKPHSYTGEDVVEIHCHGGVYLVRQVLGLMLAQGARVADPGEFTKRAFLNGRIDLSQAEAVLDLIRSRTDKGAELALSQASGGLSKWVHELREELLSILVQVEASIDFSEEEIEPLQGRDLIANIESLRRKIHDIIKTYEWGRLFREGARVCICGRPNVGKSSLLNALLGEDRVIVTEIPGTTRDVIEEPINLNGLPIVLWDTAGIRDSDDPIEQIGVKLSRRQLEKADAVLLVVDGSAPLARDDLVLLQGLDDKKALIVINKIDLPQKLEIGELKRHAGPAMVISVSGVTGDGLETLKQAVRSLMLDGPTEPPVVLTNLRHKSALARSEHALREAMATLERNHSPEFVAVTLNGAREALEEIVGAITDEDILESIFRDFCIGK